ncbi:MAG: hypothetical protein WBA74_22060 [Cyclobacteriaceae bacterium]
MVQYSHAQILTDRGKLKTVDRDKKPFIIFERSAKRSAKKKIRKRDVKTRYSNRRGRIKKSDYKPIFSTPLFGNRIKRVAPRFTRRGRIKKSRIDVLGSPAGKGRVTLKESPRYSDNYKRGRKPIVSPRYSNRKGKSVVNAKNPRYTAARKRKKYAKMDIRYTSTAKKIKPLELAEAPRISAVKKRLRKTAVSPRYTDKSHKKIGLGEAPRISDRYKRGKKTIVSPRFSDNGNFKVGRKDEPLYSEVPKAGKKPKVSPRYSKSGSRNYRIVFKNGLNIFDYIMAIPGGIILAVRPYDVSFADYRGWLKRKDFDKHKPANSDYRGKGKRDIRLVRNYKNKRRAKNLMAYDGDYKRKTAFFEKMSDRKNSRKFSDLMVPSGYNKRKKQMHPSAVNLTIKRIPSKTGKKVVEKLSKFRTKVDGNKTQPPNVRGKRRKKLKFDKKEKGLWYE